LKEKGLAMLFEKIERVAVGVKDLKAAQEFFADLLDIRFDEPLTDDNMKIRAVYSYLGLELVESTGPGSMIDKFLQQRGEGVFCIVIKVSDMKEAIRRFEAKGLRRTGELKVGGMREVAFHPKGVHGLQIVLVEYQAKHPATVAALGK